MKCQKCGYTLPEDSEFCQYCGTHLEPQPSSDISLEDVATPEDVTTTPEIVAPVQSSVDEPVSEVVSELIPPQPELVQEESLFHRAYISYLSNDPKERLFFEELIGSIELKEAYLKECDQNHKEYGDGVYDGFKQSYTEFMDVLRGVYFSAPSDPYLKTMPTSTQATFTDPAPESTEVLDTYQNHALCKKCGLTIDTITNKCNGCGKQYFNAKKNVPIAFLSVLLIASIGLNVMQYLQGRNSIETVATQTTKIEKLEKEVANQKSTISTQRIKISNLEKEVDELEYRNMYLSFDLSFYEEFAAIVPDDGTRRYHIYGCEDCDTSSFWIYNIDAAEQEGYYPCPKCY